MDDANAVFDEPLTGLSQSEWLERFEEIVTDYGTFERLDQRHISACLDGNDTLLVTFETIAGLRTLSATAQPLGWQMAKAKGWSQLSIISTGDTWFRGTGIYAFFDRLIDDGYFDAFETIVFFGAGPCAYAATAYSVAAPGARVLAVQPQATLDPRVTEWDDRFVEMRRTDFTSRFGYAPDMLDAADHAYVIYDPEQTFDAMHAALFTRSNVTKFRMRHFGASLQSDLLGMNLLDLLLERVADGTLDYTSFGKLFRIRRNNRRYLRGLVADLTKKERLDLAQMVAQNAKTRIGGPFFDKWLKRNATDAGAE